jgi:hypothetical protein
LELEFTTLGSLLAFDLLSFEVTDSDGYSHNIFAQGFLNTSFTGENYEEAFLSIKSDGSDTPREESAYLFYFGDLIPGTIHFSLE